MLEFLKLFPDILELLEAYDDAEKGRLYDAMLRYAFYGETPEFDGNERFIWAVLKRHVDLCEAKSDTQKANGLKGGRPKATETQTNPNKPKQTQTNPKKPKQTPKEQDKEQEQEHIQEQEKEETEDTRANTAAANVIDFDGSDLSADIRRQEVADAMIRRYRVQQSEVAREDLLEDIERHGEAVMDKALALAARKNSRDRLTTGFWRAFIDEARTGKAPPRKRTGEGSDYQRREYTPEQFRSIEVDLDADVGG